jgi:hypothetical protein
MEVAPNLAYELPHRDLGSNSIEGEESNVNPNATIGETIQLRPTHPKMDTWLDLPEELWDLILDIASPKPKDLIKPEDRHSLSEESFALELAPRPPPPADENRKKMHFLFGFVSVSDREAINTSIDAHIRVVRAKDLVNWGEAVCSYAGQPDAEVLKTFRC